jgi:eukaryotic-like serine/threonine-protein kinase
MIRLAPEITAMQAHPEPPELPDDPRLMQAMQVFLEQLEAGHRPNRNEFLRRYPDLAEPLAQCIAGLELVHKAASQEKPALAGPQTFSAAAEQIQPANPLGDFQIMREIGRGGMGIVYEAVQLSLGRRVALKVLPFAATLDAKHLQRFHNEAQAAAQLHHTNIVPIYAVGCDRATHFYAMQLIDGHSLAVVIRQIRQQLGRRSTKDESRPGALPPNGLVKDQPTVAYSTPLPLPGEHREPETVSQVALALSTHRSGRQEKFFATAARFVMQAAEALEHAHEYGIIHRDIKPANLLVDTHGRLWITDFGLAQFRADAGLTRTGDLLGTLRYMSPEQASGQRVLLDHRTDIYSLGATLYELVTLEPMFPEQDCQALLCQIINDEPRSPRAVDKTVPVDLETIILKAVSKNPADRYATAQEFAGDLQRYLEDKPIRAKRPSLGDRARKWMRRHPSYVVAAVVPLLVVIAALLINIRMVNNEKDKTEQALHRERERAQWARDHLNLLVEISEKEMADQPFMEDTRKRLLVAALGYYQDLSEQEQGDEDVKNQLAADRERVRGLLDKLITLQGAFQIFLVGEPPVQTDLKLSDEQKTQINKLRDRWVSESIGHLTNNEKLYQVAKQNEDALGEILDKGQLRRLKQIRLQKQGSRAFHETEVEKELGLTAEQKDKIRELERAAWDKMSYARAPADGPPGFRPPPEGGKGGGGPGLGPDHGEGPGGKPLPRDAREKFAERMKCFDESIENLVKEIVAALRPDQQTKWYEMTGEPFKGGPMFPPGPPGPFGPH